MVFGFIFELIFEIVVEVVGEFVFQVLGDAILKPLWRRYGSERRKHLLVGIFAGLVAFGYGYLWGAWRVEHGAETLPQSVWVTLAMAAAFGLAAMFYEQLPGRPPRETTRSFGPAAPGEPSSFARTVLPWLWSRARLRNFAAANVAISAGIVAGYLTWG